MNEHSSVSPGYEASPPEDYPTAVVGIGASAGGLEALKQFFQHLPEATGISFVVLQHLAPDHQSRLATILAKHTNLPVAEAEDGVALLPDQVTVLPPGKTLRLDQGRLRLTMAESPRGFRMPIDIFLRSLAQDQQDRAVAVILSGTGGDGSQGVREIKGHGGMVMVQTPREAEHDGMPSSAIETGQVDFVQPVAQLPVALVEYVQNHRRFTPHVDSDSPGGNRDIEANRLQLQEILLILQSQTRYNFHDYKAATLLRRVQRRMGLCGVENLIEYIHLLRDRNDEVQALAQDLLICVTSFFRNPDAWQALREQVLEPLVAEKSRNERIRFWIPGCATGEEAYTLAILMSEVLQDRPDLRLQIFATDINQHALAMARAAVYPTSIAADLSEERLRRHFIPDGDYFRLIKSLRETVIFAVQDLKGDSPFPRLDLVSCRNLLIYLEPQAQQQVLSRIHFALNPGGYLFLGSSETPHRLENSFNTVSEHWRIYQRIGANQSFLRFGSRLEPLYRDTPLAQKRPAPSSASQLQTLTAELSLRESQAAALLVDRELRPLYISGMTDPFFTVPTGEQRKSLLAMTRSGLHGKLRSALHRALQHQERSVHRRIPVQQANGSVLPARLVVQPLNDHNQQPLIFIQVQSDTALEETTTTPAGTLLEPLEPNQELEQELFDTREELSDAIEQLEQANEELRTSNEEAMSTNEELEASREELQSLNEELTTLNAQLEDKLKELEDSNNDRENFIASTRIAVLFLDTGLHIREFTPEAMALFRLIRADLGRPMADLAYKFDDGESLATQARQVLKTLDIQEHEIQSDGGRWFNRRILPYRTEDNRVEGVVVTFNDITALKSSQALLAKQREQLRLITDALPVLIAYVDTEERYRFVNASYQAWFGITPKDIVGKGIAEVIGAQAYEACRPYIQRALQGEAFSWETELHYRKAGYRHVLIDYIPQRNSADELQGYYALIQDITNRKTTELELRRSESRFRHVFEHAAMGIGTLDTHGRFLLVNERLAEIIGYSQKALLHQRDRDLTHPDDQTATDDELARLVRGEQASYSQVKRYRRQDGQIIWVTLNVSIIDPDAPELERMAVAVIHDITAAKQMEDQLRETNQRQNDFLAILSHELRNPLAPIRTGLDLMKLQEDNGRYADLLAMMERQIHQLTRLVNDLMDISRLTRDKVTLQRERLSLALPVQRAIEATRPLMAERHQLLDVVLPDEDIVLEADPERLTQIFSNLLHNATKFTPKEGWIKLEAQPVDGSVTVTVTDNGIGINHDQVEEVFAMFTHGSTDLEREQGSLGIGLTLVRSLVELHGGRVTASSDGAGKGSRFRVELPRIDGSLPPQADATDNKSRPVPSRRILVVDDNHDAADSLGQMLTATGHSVETVYSGHQALDIVPRWQPDVVLLDLGMPGLPGQEVARRLRTQSQGNQLTLVAVTGWSQSSDRDSTQEAGFDYHLVKPVDLTTLENLLRGELGNSYHDPDRNDGDDADGD